MGEHKCKIGVKGSGYKAVQDIQPKPLRIKPAQITEKWMRKHGYELREDGKWVKVYK